MKKLILLFVVLAGAGYGLLSYHFVLFDNELKIMKKTGMRYENTFVDARGDKARELFFKPDLMAAGLSDMLDQVNEEIRKEANRHQ